AFPGTIGRIEHGFTVRPDLCAVHNPRNPRSYLGKFYLDALVHDQDALLHLLGLVGPEKLVLGWDYPFPLGEEEPGKLIESMDMPEQVKERLLSENALEFLGLEKTRFRPEPEQGPATSEAARE